MSEDRKPKDRPGRSYASLAMKATSHPLREKLLRLLAEGPRTTVELEELTGESRYNLYHHLAVLEQSLLVGNRLTEGRTKEYSLRQPSRPECAVLILDEKDEEESKFLQAILDVVEQHMPGRIPNLRKIRRGKLLFYYPWSGEE